MAFQYEIVLGPNCGCCVLREIRSSKIVVGTHAVLDRYSILFSSFKGKIFKSVLNILFIAGIFMLFISINVTDWLGDESGVRKPRIWLLTIVFFCCNFLAATQDIAVDGWALTMLHK